MNDSHQVIRTDRPLTMREYYKSLGYGFETWTYSHSDGQTFTIERPIGLPLNYPYYGRRVTSAEVLAIWQHHRDLLEAHNEVTTPINQ